MLSNYQFDDERLIEIGIHKSFNWVRPEHMHPKGKISMDEVRHTINDQRDKCLIWLDRLKNGEGILAKTTMTVNMHNPGQTGHP